MDYTSSMVYKMSKGIADLKPLVGKTKYHVKNTTHFRKDICDLCVGNDELMNSHDVVSLFTNIPIQVEMIVIRDRLEKIKTLSECTDLSADNIMRLLKFVMSTTYFQFEGVLYQQVHGVPMVSVVVADMFKEDMEQSTMNSTSPQCKSQDLEKTHRRLFRGGEKGTDSCVDWPLEQHGLHRRYQVHRRAGD